jgi:hypothetical protein
MEIKIPIILDKSPAGVDFPIQEGKGSNYTTVQKQRSHGKDLTFNCTVEAGQKASRPNFTGPLVQGPHQIDLSISTLVRRPPRTNAPGVEDSRYRSPE